MPEDNTSLYNYHKIKQSHLSFIEISTVLHFIVSHYSTAFILIDALNKCQVSSEGRKMLLSGIFNLWIKIGVNLFATTHFIPEIMKEFEGTVSLEICASQEDVQIYLDEYMSQLSSCVLQSCGCQSKIQTEIIKAVDGMCVPSI